jgi:2-polyprenyl-3-methyl-5-hydroxy-6-metoxy-1,4-benzoquinol methylase
MPMPVLIDPTRFRKTYRSAVADVMPFITRDCQEVISLHDRSLHPDRHDLHAYLQASTRRYINAIELLNRHAAISFDELRLLDVGGFLGAFPLALARLGVPVTLVEEYGYYGGALDELKTFLESESITVWSTDFTAPLENVPPERFTLVTNMAMIEHLPSSPKILLENLHSVTAENGKLILEAPNIAYLPNRLKLLKGRSVHSPIDVCYTSEPPFLGHHHEYTERELHDVLHWSGFRVNDILTFNYSLNYSLSIREGKPSDRIRLRIAYWWAISWLRSCREVLMACASPLTYQDLAAYATPV